MGVLWKSFLLILLLVDGGEMEVLSRLLVRRAGWIAFIGTLLGLVGGYFSVLLYMNLRTNIEELLPVSARSIQDLQAVSSRLKVVDNIVVLAFSKEPKASQRFMDDLALRLEQTPKEVISAVEYRIQNELSFFKARQALFIELQDLERIKSYIHSRLNYEASLFNPVHIFSETDLKEPQLDFENLKSKYAGKLSDFERFPEGYYATADESIRLMTVYMPVRGLDKALEVKQAILESVKALNPKSYSQDLEIKYTGNGENLIEESAALVEDLELSTLIVITLVAAAMIAFFRTWWGTLVLNLALFMGTFWTFGCAWFLVGYLNANTAFLASIVIGNGINFGVIYLARYLEERRRLQTHEVAIGVAFKQTFTATLTAALAAGLSYGSLMFTGFRGFSQFGVIGLFGMMLCWLSALVLLPAYITLLDRWQQGRWIALEPPKSVVSSFLAQSIQRYPGTIWWFSVAGVLVSIAVVFQVAREDAWMEMDFSKLRDKRSMSVGSGSLYHYIDEIFGKTFSPLVIMPHTEDQAELLTDAFRELKKTPLGVDVIGSVSSLQDFLPRQQTEKIQILKEIRSLLPPKVLRMLPQAEQELAQQLLNPLAFVPFSALDLPKMVLDRFQETDGLIGNMVLVDKKYDQTQDDAQHLFKFVKLGRETTDGVGEGIPVAGDLPISYDLFYSVLRDGPKATWIAFCSVLVLVVLLFRNLKTILLCLMALWMGMAWLAGIFFGFKLKINFLNFIALPITFGIGIDYGVNIFQRYRELGSGRILDVVRHTGGAVLLCSLATSIGVC
jgi:uncharacterized protein